MKAILTYHSIDESGSPISVSAEAFRKHVSWLASGVVRVASVAELLLLPDDANAVAITFDDGFENFGTTVAPLLLESGLPATLFIVTDSVGGTNRWGGVADPHIPEIPLLRWTEIARMAEMGIEIGSHTRSHPHLPRLGPAAVADELIGSAERLRIETGRAPAGFAYPYGEVSEESRVWAETIYRWACTTSMRALTCGEQVSLLPRVDMYYFRDPGRLESWGSARFRQYLWLRSRVRQVRLGLTSVAEHL